MYELYGGKPPHVAGCETSTAAAEAAEDRIPNWRTRVFRYIRDVGGATCDEVEVGLQMPHTTCSARIRELVLLTVLRDSGLRRKTRGGCNAKVWIVAE